MALRAGAGSLTAGPACQRFIINAEAVRDASRRIKRGIDGAEIIPVREQGSGDLTLIWRRRGSLGGLPDSGEARGRGQTDEETTASRTRCGRGAEVDRGVFPMIGGSGGTPVMRRWCSGRNWRGGSGRGG